VREISSNTLNTFTSLHSLKTAVLFLVFNRPDTTKQVFETIRQARPKQLFVAADAPRAGWPDETKKCDAARQIATNVDWPCDVKTLFHKKNLGCRVAVSSAIDWFFKNVEEGIILEDDCLPNPTFFRFCHELLTRYRGDERVMVVSGNNFQFGNRRTDYSYYFSRYMHCWGWATWRKAWQYYDKDMESWPFVRDTGYLLDILQERQIIKYWLRVLEKAYRCEVDSWAYQWTFSCWVQSGLTILPNINLVSNIGFGEESTHTKGGGKNANIPAVEILFPLKHPPLVIRDNEADRQTHKACFKSSLARRLINRIKRCCRKQIFYHNQQ